MPLKRANPKSYERVRALRKELTPAERKLWSVLRGKKIIIELDGSQQLDQIEYDEERSRYLESQEI